MCAKQPICAMKKEVLPACPFYWPLKWPLYYPVVSVELHEVQRLCLDFQQVGMLQMPAWTRVRWILRTWPWR
jgi:hypothetical protein